MKKALFILIPILAMLAALAFVIFPGSIKSQEQKQIELLWSDSEAVFLAEVTEIEKPTPARRFRLVGATYKILATHRGMNIEKFEVVFEIPEPGPIELPADTFFVGARHLLFLRQPGYGPFGGSAREPLHRMRPATDERLKIVEVLARPK